MSGQDADDGRHILTVDVEEYFQSSAFSDLVIPEEWPSLPSRVHLATERLLEVLAEHDTTATFFFGPWVADRHPNVVERISRQGHEVASRDSQRPTEFGEDVFTPLSRLRAFKSLLETLGSQHVDGHRTSLGDEGDTEALTSRIARAGYQYVSWPRATPRTGSRSADEGDHAPCQLETGGGPLLEFPLAGVQVFGVTLPVSGRPSLRHVPYGAVRRVLDSYSERSVPAVLTLRSWEVDEYQPRFALTPLNRAVQYGRLQQTVPRLNRLLADHRFCSARDYFGLERAERDPDRSPPGPARPEVESDRRRKPRTHST